MKEIIQISEEQAREMILCVNGAWNKRCIDILRDAGYIKKSRIKAARDFVLSYESQCDRPEDNEILEYLKDLQILYESAIIELCEDENEQVK